MAKTYGPIMLVNDPKDPWEIREVRPGRLAAKNSGKVVYLARPDQKLFAVSASHPSVRSKT